MARFVSRWHPFPSCSLSHPHIYTSHLVRCVSGPADLNLMSKCAPCLATPCQNNGTCVSDVTGSYHCTCPFGFKVSEHLPPHIQHILGPPARMYRISLWVMCIITCKRASSSIFPSWTRCLWGFLISSYCTQEAVVCVVDACSVVRPWRWGLGPLANTLLEMWRMWAALRR